MAAILIQTPTGLKETLDKIMPWGTGPEEVKRGGVSACVGVAGLARKAGVRRAWEAWGSCLSQELWERLVLQCWRGS